MTRVTPLDKLRVPLGGQEIELQQIDFEAGGMSLLRTRIREKSRGTRADYLRRMGYRQHMPTAGKKRGEI